MLRVTDARTGEQAELGAGGRPLRIVVRVPGTDGRLGPGALRAALAGDVLARTADLEGRPVLLTRQVPQGYQEQMDEAAAALQLSPAERSLDGPPSVTVAPSPAEGAPAEDEAAASDEGVLLAVGAVSGEARLPRGVDPLALRLVLLRHPRQQPFTVTAGELADAQVQLGRWRRKVAEWANAPSQPIPDELRRRCDDALGRDLDVPEVLRLLDEVETGSLVPNGARFELFSFADRVLGLELVREIGRW